MILRWLAGADSHTATLVQVRTAPWDPDHSTTVVTNLAGRSGTRYVVLQPMSREGQTFLDDGNFSIHYDPEEKRVYKQRSTRDDRLSSRDRTDLISSNYKLHFHKPETIAGRLTHVIHAEPRRPLVSEQVLYIDAERYVMLRSEVETERGDTMRTLDTRSVKFYPAGYTIDLRSDVIEDAKVIEGWGPVPFGDPRGVRESVGFTPRIPDETIHGFRVMSKHLIGHSYDPFVRLTLTDGLATVTIYQWSAAELGQDDQPFGGRADRKDKWGISYRVRGDVSDDLADHILDELLEIVGRSIFSDRNDPQPPSVTELRTSAPSGSSIH